MKKLLMIAAFAVALASCSKTETQNPDLPKGIRFTNLNDKVTRAANDANANYQVYAKWSGGSGWYIDDVVNGTTNLATGGLHYWPSSGTVDFYSWAPASSSSIVATTTYPTLSIAYTVPAAANEDFTIAAPVTGLSSGTVPFQFAHMLSKITVSADLTQDLKDAGYSLTFTGGAATLNVNSTGGTIDPTAATPAWTSPNSTTAAYSGALSYMVLPQTSTGCKIQITGGITITKGGSTVFTGGLSEYTIANNDITGNQFQSGKQYQLILVISDTSTENGGGNIFGDAITFTAATTPWDAVTPDPSLPQP